MKKRQFSVLCRLLILLVIGLWSVPLHAQDDSCAPTNLDTREWDLTDFCRHVDGIYEEIRDVIVPRTRVGIIAIDDPTMETIESASEWLVAQSPVIAVEIDDEARAYPLAILTWHEIANDTINDVPIAVTFCPLCNSSIVYDRRVEGETLLFSVSGKLRNSDLIMYDRETQSWWQQFTGEGIVGTYTGVLLDIVPSRVIGFGQFAEHYPDGQVMSRDTGINRPYGENPYGGYDDSGPIPGFINNVDTRLAATSRVLAGIIGGESIAYPYAILNEHIVINDTVAGVDVVAFWQPGVFSALDSVIINSSDDVGTAGLFSRELDGQVLTFIADENGVVTDEQTGSTWNLFGEAIEGDLAGSQLRQFNAFPHFWFAWAAFYPDTRIYGADAE